MKKNYFFVLLFLIHTHMFSQVPVISVGAMAENSKQLPLLNIIGQVNNETWVLRGKQEAQSFSFELSLFGSDLNRIVQNSFMLEGGNDAKWFYLGSEILDDVPWLFVSHFSGIEKKHEAWAIPMGEKGAETDKKVLLESIPSFSMNNAGNFRISVSADKNYILVFRENPSDKTKNETFAASVFSNKLTFLWKQEYTTDISSKPNPVNEPLITNDGSIYVVKKDREKTAYKFTAFFIDKSGHALSYKPISVAPKVVTDIKAMVNSQGKLVVFGFFATTDYSLYEGLFCYMFNASGNQEVKHTENLNSDVLSQFMSKKEAEKEGALSGFVLEYLAPVSEGGFYALAEKTKQVTEKEGEHYTYGDILIVAMDQNGNMKWGKGVSKNQQSMNDEARWSSFNYFVYNDTLHLLHNKVVMDASLAKSGKLGKKDEFGDKSFAGTNWYWIAADRTNGGAPLTEMHKSADVQMAFNPDMIFVNEKNEVFLLTEDYFSNKTALVSLIPPVIKPGSKEEGKDKGKAKY